MNFIGCDKERDTKCDTFHTLHARHADGLYRQMVDELNCDGVKLSVGIQFNSDVHCAHKVLLMLGA